VRHDVYALANDVIYVCWGLVGVVWLVGTVAAFARGRNVVRRGRDLTQLVGLIVAVAIALLPPWGTLDVRSPALAVTGMGLLAASAALAIWARAQLGLMWSATPLAREHHELRTAGPYRLVRHPIYTAILGMLAGTVLAGGVGQLAGALVAVTVVLVTRMRAEERLLIGQFGDEYERYRARTPALIPGIRLRRADPSGTRRY
jgi:protein-S-isoprenylcysteine O-methyltransferase Ste14